MLVILFEMIIIIREVIESRCTLDIALSFLWCRIDEYDIWYQCLQHPPSSTVNNPIGIPFSDIRKSTIVDQEVGSLVDSPVGGSEDIPFLVCVMNVSYRHPGLNVLRLGDDVKGKLDTGRI